jgi:hypothetical protein
MGEGPEIPLARLREVVGYGLVWLADVLRALGHQSIG